jgi:hypothetical protein
MANVGAVIARIITQYSDKGSKAAQRDARKLEKSFETFSKRAKLAFAGAAAGAGYFAQRLAKEGVRAAAEEDRALASLGRTLENVGQAFAIPQVNEFISAQQAALGVSEDQLRPAFQRLVTVLGDAGLAQEQLSLALDVSAGTGKSLDQVVMALSRAYSGNTAGLSRLGAGLDKTLLKSGDLVAITGELNKKFGGQAAVAAASFGGSLNKIKIAADEAKESIGQAIINAIIGQGGDAQNQVEGLTRGIAQFGDMVATAFTFVIPLVKEFFGFLKKIFTTLNNMRPVISAVAGLLAGIFVAGKVIAFVSALQKVVKVMKAIRSAGLAASVATAFATGGVSVAAGAAGAAAAVAAMGLSITAANKLFNGLDKASAKVAKNSKATSTETGGVLKPTKTLADLYKDIETKSGKTAANAKALTAEQKTQAAVLKFAQSAGIDPTKDFETVNLFAAAVRKVGADATEEQKKTALVALQTAGNTAQESVSLLASAIREVTNKTVGSFGDAASAAAAYNEAIKAGIQSMVDAGITDVDLLKTAFGSLNTELLNYIGNLTAAKNAELTGTGGGKVATTGAPTAPSASQQARAAFDAAVIVGDAVAKIPVGTTAAEIKVGQTAVNKAMDNLLEQGRNILSSITGGKYGTPIPSAAPPPSMPSTYIPVAGVSQTMASNAPQININAPVYGIADLQRLIIDSVNQAQKNGTTTVLPNGGR